MSKEKMRVFGKATRDLADNKIDPDGALHPLVIKGFCEYMKKHENTPLGKRESNNWWSLFGERHYDICMKSLWRHLLDLSLFHHGYKGRDTIEDALCGIIFNAQAYYLKYLKDKNTKI